MLDMLSLSLANLTSPPILFFLLGLGAALLRSDLSIPETIGKSLAMYLMIAIGFKGGVEVAGHGFGGALFASIVAGVLLSFLLPVIAFGLLRLLSQLDTVNRAAISAHYGSVSIVTFVTAVQYLSLQGLEYEPFLIAVVALMETPAIVTGILLSQRSAQTGAASPMFSGYLVREVLLNGSVVLLVGAFFIGMISGESGKEALEPFTGGLFTGILCLFLLDMGLVAGRRLLDARLIQPGLVVFAIIMPIIGAAAGLLSGTLAGLSVGGTALLATLAASASYIAVPAAMRVALPQANPGIYLTLSLAITFPFNITLGIPAYQALAQWLN